MTITGKIASIIGIIAFAGFLGWQVVSHENFGEKQYYGNAVKVLAYCQENPHCWDVEPF